MSDTQNSSFAEKAAKVILGGAAIGGIAAVTPQDELMKDGLPGLWESIKGIARKGWLHLNIAAEKFHPIAFRWLAKLWSFIKWWTLMSIALVVVGIEVKSRTGSNLGHVLVAGGTISFAGLGLLLFALSDGISNIAYVGLKTCGSVFGRVTSFVGVHPPELIDELTLLKFRGKVRLILAGTVVMTFSLLFTMFFPAWSTLGWTLIFWAMVAVAVVAAIYLDMQMGKAVRAVFYATLAMIVITFAIFLLDRLTGGALGFGGFRKWLLALNRSELIPAILVLIPATLLIVSVFAKDKDMRGSYRDAAKFVAAGALILGMVLAYKGTISWKQATGKDAPDLSWPGKSKQAARSEPAYAPQGTTSNGGQYMAPPTADAAPRVEAPVPSKPPKAKTRRASKPLPKEEPKKYSNLTQGMDDLEALGY